MNIDRYKKLNKYLINKYGERTLKICIDGNFTCPNRDGTKSTKGCIFCSRQGSGEHIEEFINSTINNSSRNNSQNIPNYYINQDIKNDYLNQTNSISFSTNYIKYQIENYFNSYKALRANKFIVYFQNFTNTYDSIYNLKAKYDSALINPKIVCLDIATRPDCINEEVCKLLYDYKKKYDVWVELGLQTSNPRTGNIINRCYNNSDFTNAVNLLNKYDIEIITHIMIGLPNENQIDLKNTVNFINSHKIHGLKIHSTYIVKNTKLEDMYLKREYLPLSLEDYINNVCFILANINPNIIIHKLSGDAPKSILVAPDWNSHKKWILNGIQKYLNENNIYQGMNFKPD